MKRKVATALVGGERNPASSFHRDLNALQDEMRAKQAEWSRRFNALRRAAPPIDVVTRDELADYGARLKRETIAEVGVVLSDARARGGSFRR